MTDAPAAWHRLAPDSLERHMLAVLSDFLAVPLEPRVFSLPSHVRAEVEGASADNSVLVKLTATTGNARSAQRNKALADMVKLTWLRTSAAPGARLILAVTPPIAGYFSPTSWPAHAAKDLTIDVVVVDGDQLTWIVGDPGAHVTQS